MESVEQDGVDWVLSSLTGLVLHRTFLYNKIRGYFRYSMVCLLFRKHLCQMTWGQAECWME